MSNDHHADIVIINYNTRAFLERCLQSIASYTEYPHRVTVVDNGSTEHVDSLSLDAQGINLIVNSENRGYARACNLGAEAGDGAYIVFLNSDTFVTPGWLNALVTCAEADDRVAVVGSKLLDARGCLAGTGFIGDYDQPRVRGWGEPDVPGRYQQPEDVIGVCGACFLIKRALIPDLGLFDERYFFYYEDLDYCRHVRSQGFRVVFCPDSRVHHYFEGGPVNRRWRNQVLADSRRLFREKWADPQVT